ncbi:deoxyhypusine synthase family protein [Desulfohalobium retbaense]|uniref:Deoxyhypusine synthase n=1 Tax=Desulfohalobium retbaense (strain ATCC 49708 / DSM 5692 / JCM 16813 / HR100) TaxID=485915 RepID=C8X2F3_DESRD|nr:deoxyhypusine synthase family protein [Desulfohalobium retbaense]ACV68600.1 deoxyhypusine synthase [Desulfohalobium retbaense DSM 5692]
MSDEHDHIRLITELGNPEEEGFEPLSLLDPDSIQDFDDLLSAMSQTSFGGRGLGEALGVLEEMVQDPDCHVVGTFSGAMTVAKMGKLLCSMIDKGWIDTVISTGALMAHGFIESIGLKHYKYVPERMNDAALFERGFNRVYDTLEPEINFAQAEDVVHAVMAEIEDWNRMGSASLCRAIGAYLDGHFQGPGILKSAFQRDVPVFIPAFTDSELALDVASHILRHSPQAVSDSGAATELPFQFNPFYDLFEYTRRVCGAKRLGIFTIGGGVPRNWAQQVGPFVEIVNQRVEGLDLPVRRFQYGVRICPEPAHWGGLSGCTYQEGISWGKFVPPAQGGRFAEVHSDATIAWPILIKGLQDRLAKKAQDF